MKKFFVWTFLSFTFLFSINIVKAQITSFDVTNYNAEIEPYIADKSVKGKVAIQFTSLKNNLTEIQLNAGNLEIDAVREKRTALKFEKKDALLNITLARVANLNEKREIQIEYHGAPKYGIKFYPAQSQVYTLFSTSGELSCCSGLRPRHPFPTLSQR